MAKKNKSTESETKTRAPRKPLAITDQTAASLSELANNIYGAVQNEQLDETTLNGLTKAYGLVRAASERVQRRVNKANKPSRVKTFIEKHREEILAVLKTEE